MSEKPTQETCEEKRDLDDFREKMDQDLDPGDMFSKEPFEPVTPSCLLYTSPSPRDVEESRFPSSA